MIDFNDFLQMMTAKMCEKDTREEIFKAFKLFDDDSTGKISFKNLKRVARELGENLTDEELQVLFDILLLLSTVALPCPPSAFRPPPYRPTAVLQSILILPTVERLVVE